MRLQNRIKKIESKVKIIDSPFCTCESFGGKVYPLCEIVLENKGVQTIENPVPDFCERCRKPIEKEQIIICFV